uniref:Uncharacterized protein n=1 Tax=Rousettus aegyptiacus TaxID=9407 RepID=A0A7J8F0W3_ROUAE|nr:hypothetical protein HJG63_012443 [Rousettus aegyptiacus]
MNLSISLLFLLRSSPPPPPLPHRPSAQLLPVFRLLPRLRRNVPPPSIIYCLQTTGSARVMRLGPGGEAAEGGRPGSAQEDGLGSPPSPPAVAPAWPARARALSRLGRKPPPAPSSQRPPAPAGSPRHTRP